MTMAAAAFVERSDPYFPLFDHYLQSLSYGVFRSLTFTAIEPEFLCPLLWPMYRAYTQQANELGIVHCSADV